MSDATEALNVVLDRGPTSWSALEPFDRALRNRFPKPYVPQIDAPRLEAEYASLMVRANLNVVRLVVNALVDRCQAIGVRVDGSTKPDKQVWSWWQASQMDHRQKLVMRDSAGLADGYLLVTPGVTEPTFTAQSPLQLAVELDDYDPTRVVRAAKAIKDRAWLYTEAEIVAFTRPRESLSWEVETVTVHAGGQCPIVRFPNELDSLGRSMSELEPIMPIQSRINQTVFDRLLLQRHQAWRQRWATGADIDDDDSGKAINPYPNAGADTILVNESADGKFGEFAQAELKGLIEACNADLQSVALVSRTPPHYLPISSISNISAETLTGLAAAFESREKEHKRLWGESFLRAIQIGGAMVGRVIDPNAEIIWADYALESEAQRADAAGKLKAIGFPLRYLAERMSMTDDEITRMMAMADEEARSAAKAVATSYGLTSYGPDGAVRNGA